MVTSGIDTPSPSAPAPEQTNWEDNFSERPFSQDGRGNQWQDWGQVMHLAIDPPVGCLEDVLRRTPISNPLDQAEVSVLWRLMIDQITCPASRYGLELRLLQDEITAITEVVASANVSSDDDFLQLKPSEWKEFSLVINKIPLTRAKCIERMNGIRIRMEDIHSLIDVASRGGVYYDVCGLIDWFATPMEKRATSSPSHVLPYFGQVLFGILGLSGQNTAWAHIEAVTSRQMAPKFGGTYDENEKTRQKQPGVLGPAQNQAQTATPGV